MEFQVALVKCGECKKEVSDQALVCPHCGLTAPAKIHPKTAPPPLTIKQKLTNWSVAAVILIVLFQCSTNGFKSDEAKKADSKAAQLELEECKHNDACCFDKNRININIFCKKAIKEESKYDFKWDDDSFMFDIIGQYKVNSETGLVTIFGSKAKAQTPTGAYKKVTYSCAYDFSNSDAPIKNIQLDWVK